MDITTIAQIAGLLIVAIVTLRAGLGLRALTVRRRYLGSRASEREQEVLTYVSDLTKQMQASQQETTEGWNWKGTRKFEITNRTYENLARDICSFYLTPLDRQPLPAFLPGQFLTIQTSIPGEEKPVSRCYSLSDSPSQKQHFRISVKKVPAPAGAPNGTPPGRVSTHLHDFLKQGDIIEVEAPSGDFYLDPTLNRPCVLIAGGVGITPILSMLNTLTQIRSQADIWLFFGVRNSAEHPFREHLNQLKLRNPNLNIVTAYSRPTPNCILGSDYEIEGHIDIVLLQHLLRPANYQFFVCGPTPMMDSIPSDLTSWGVPPEDIKTESFGSATRGTTAPPSYELKDDGQTFQVTFSKSGKQIEWSPSRGTLLDLAEANNIKTRHNCRAGVCGTCKTGIVSGKITYVREVTNEPEPGSCLACSAIPESDITLDL